MDLKLLTGIVYNISLLLALSIVYAIIPAKSLFYRGYKRIVVGIIIGFAGISIMANPYLLASGLYFDVRSVLLLISGMFAGPVPTLIAAAMTAVFRILNGGIGTLMGVSVIVLSSSVGLIWNKFRFQKVFQIKKNRLLEIYAVGLFTHIGMLACTLLLPPENIMTTLKAISVPVLTIYPLGALLLGMLLFRQMDNIYLLQHIEESEQRYRSLFEDNNEKMLLIKPEGYQIIDANPAACAYYGWTRDELKNKTVSEITATPEEEIAHEIEVIRAGHRDHLHLKHRLASGELRDVEIFEGPIRYKEQELLYLIVHDSTNRRVVQRRLEESENRLKVTLLSVGDGVITTDNEGTITLINRKAREMTGRGDDAVGRPFASVIRLASELSGEGVLDPVSAVICTGNAAETANHTMLLRADGADKPIAHSASPIKDDRGSLLGVVFVFRDVTEEKQKQQQIKYMGYHDGLTGLYNRSFFDEELKRLDTKRNLPISVIVGDVNGLKLTNDAFGHAAGDELLCRMAAEIKNACRKEDIIARWGGDEFIILLPATDEKAAEGICDRIRANCSKIKMGDVSFSISLGFETKKSADEDIGSVVKSAEDYMYRKKSIESSSIRGKTIQTILLAFHERNPLEQQHSKRVSTLCRRIAQSMGLPKREVNEMELVGLVHDIGKIAISERVLEKRTPLTPREWKELMRHPEIGYRILSASNEMGYIADYVLKHHERPDGKGYPRGTGAADIPLQSKILSVADAYDAMTSERPYRHKMSREKAIKELKAGTGTQFDSFIVDLFVNSVLRKKEIQTESALDGLSL